MKNMEIIQIDKLEKTKVEPETHKINFNIKIALSSIMMGCRIDIKKA